MQVLIAVGEPGADAERLQRLSDGVRAELLDLDVDDVRPVRTGEVPPGARAVDAAAVGAFIVSLGGSAESLQQIFTALRSWVGRSRAPRSIEMTIGDKTLRISDASLDQQERLIKTFVELVRED